MGCDGRGAIFTLFIFYLSGLDLLPSYFANVRFVFFFSFVLQLHGFMIEVSAFLNE